MEVYPLPGENRIWVVEVGKSKTVRDFRKRRPVSLTKTYSGGRVPSLHVSHMSPLVSFSLRSPLPLVSRIYGVILVLPRLSTVTPPSLRGSQFKVSNVDLFSYL